VRHGQRTRRRGAIEQAQQHRNGFFVGKGVSADHVFGVRIRVGDDEPLAPAG
jgi:hypothetical protein